MPRSFAVTSTIILALIVAAACSSDADEGDGTPGDSVQEVAADTTPQDSTLVDTAVDTTAPDTPTPLDTVDELVLPDVADEIAMDMAEETPEEDTVEPPYWVEVPETVVATTEPSCPTCQIVQNDVWDGAGQFLTPTSTDYALEQDGLTFYFRPFVRFRMPHPGKVTKIFVLADAGVGELEVGLSTGFPGGHHPCLDEASGKDPYLVGEAMRMPTTGEVGWRVFDVADLDFVVGGYDELFVIFDQLGETKVGLSDPVALHPSDYDAYAGLVADVPADGMTCFPSQSFFEGPSGAPLVWLVRIEIEPTEIIETKGFHEPEGAPAFSRYAAFHDYDGDGDDDLLSGGKLWQNDGAGGFVDVSTDAEVVGLKGQALWGDYDNDGYADILSVGSGAVLLRGGDDGTFADVTTTSGVSVPSNAQGLAWLDLDGDAHLDFYAASYGTLEDGEVATRDYLYYNAADGTFADFTDYLGIPTTGTFYHGRGITVADYDNDGDPDIYVGNYRLDPNQLWANKGGFAGFVDKAQSAGVKGNPVSGSFGHTIGPAWGDLDNDGWLDLVVANLAHPRFISFSDPTLVYFNGGDGTFDEVAPPDSGIAYDETHSHALLFDYDNDGDLDLFLTAVYVGRRSYLYDNDGTGYFTDVTYEAGILHFNGWGAAASDVDGDGDLDLVADRLFVNDLASGNHFVGLDLEGAATPDQDEGVSNRDAIGAVVTLVAGGLTQTRQVEAGSGVSCQSSHTLHFGLGAATTIDSVTIAWPSGQTTTEADLAVDQIHHLLEPAP